MSSGQSRTITPAVARLCSVHMSTVPCVRLGTALEHPSAEHVRVALVCGPRLFFAARDAPELSLAPAAPDPDPGPAWRDVSGGRPSPFFAWADC